jgi:hypothetical protein
MVLFPELGRDDDLPLGQRFNGEHVNPFFEL